METYKAKRKRVVTFLNEDELKTLQAVQMYLGNEGKIDNMSETIKYALEYTFNDIVEYGVRKRRRTN